MGSPPDHRARSFQFERDTFPFANELVWQYRFDPATGAMSVSPCDPPPVYTHRCFVMVRSARQFLYHARFEPGRPAADAESYRRLIRQVVARNPRRAGAESERIVIPGYDGLRAFSQAHEPLLKAECGGPLQSYFVRSHWRMVFMVPAWHQERMAGQLAQRVREGAAPIVHLFRFPRITINHGILLFGSTESDRGVEFDAYDPNFPDHPVKLAYDRAARSFIFPRALYWQGGPVNVYEMYIKGLY